MTGPRKNDVCGHASVKHYARGYCSRCYATALRRGELDMRKCVTAGCHGNRSGSSELCKSCGDRPSLLGLPARFWHLVRVSDDVPDDDPCWVWVGHKGGDRDRNTPQWSYGDRELVCTHSVFTAYTGALVNECVTHTCRNRACVNPRHLVETSLRLAIDNQRAAPLSGARGVTKMGRRWQAQTRVNGERVVLGYFDTRDGAVRAYRDAVRQLEGAA